MSVFLARMQDSNPYAVPEAAFTPPPIISSSELFRRNGKHLMVWDGAVLPARCIKTNQPISSDGVTKTRKMVYTPPWVWAFLLFGLLIGALLAMALQKKFTATYSLSREVHKRLRNRMILGLLLLFGGLGGIIGGTIVLGSTSEWIGPIIGVGMLVFLTGLVLLTLITPLRPIRHKSGWFTLKGCSPEFIDSIAPN